jgi:hypothetical protein
MKLSCLGCLLILFGLLDLFAIPSFCKDAARALTKPISRDLVHWRLEQSSPVEKLASQIVTGHTLPALKDSTPEWTEQRSGVNAL